MSERIAGAQSVVYHVERSTVRYEGLVPIPVAGATDGTQEVEIVRLHSPWEMHIVSWVATKIGEAPTVPHPTLLDTNHVFLWGARSAAIPPKDLAGGHVWAISGIYYYATKKPVGLASEIVTGRQPWDPLSANDNKIPGTIFRQDLLEGGGRPTFIGIIPRPT